MLNREEFAAMWEAIRPGLGKSDSGLWAGEEDGSPAGQWFINVKQIHASNKMFFWDWVKENLDGKIRCYSSSASDNEEWWGFTVQHDVPIWVLRWA